mmetsp:Transcript_12200/g.36785  ORF Transcript_12200/g.36785 Transcript_12200/m.36785 type:complete len:358 (-) Transcript_12200:572-1645(-)
MRRREHLRKKERKKEGKHTTSTTSVASALALEFFEGDAEVAGEGAYGFVGGGGFVEGAGLDELEEAAVGEGVVVGLLLLLAGAALAGVEEVEVFAVEALLGAALLLGELVGVLGGRVAAGRDPLGDFPRVQRREGVALGVEFLVELDLGVRGGEGLAERGARRRVALGGRPASGDVLVVVAVGTGVGAVFLQELLEHLAALRGLGVLVELARLDDEGVHVEFVGGAREDAFFDGGGRDETEHAHVVALAYAVRSVLRLRVHHRVPVAVEDHDGVGGRQIQTEAAGSRGEQEDERGRARVVELGHAPLALVGRRRPVQSEEGVAAEREELFQQVHGRRHLRKEQDAVASRFEQRQHAV